MGLKHKDTNLIVYTAPKANCTTIAKSFFKHCGLLEEALNYSSWVHDYQFKKYTIKRDTNGKLINMVTLDDLKNKDKIKIKFMRCPYDRAVSSYLCLRGGGCSGENDSFNQFLKYLSNKRVIIYNESNINIHAQTQSFIQESEFEWDEILEVENDEENAKLIKNKYNIELDFNFTSGHWRKQQNIPITGNVVANVPFKDLNIRKINYVDFYGPEERKLVEKIYKIDFDCSNYTFERFIERNS